MPHLPELEEKVLKFWESEHIFEKMKAENKKTGKYFAFLDGPITANYPMGLHHTWNRSLKDIMLKFAALNGCDAHYQNGFDAHGLPVELSVEKELGLNSKKEIEKFGIANFIEACLKRVEVYSKKQTDQSIRLGQWMDWDDSYFTNADSNITAIWHFLKECHKRGWIVEKFRPTPWCTRCGTALSEHEMSDVDAYKDIEHMAVFFKLPVKNTNYSVVVWTTTPWTLSSNVAVAVNPKLEYSICKVKSSDRLLIVCSDALKILRDDLISVETTVIGEELVGLEYETCFPELKQQAFTHKIVAWDAVDATEGSGMVHIAPGCGAEDFDLGQELGLPNVMPIDEAGNFYDDFGFLAGKNANEVADLVFDELKARNKLYYTHKYKHRYPHCWRGKNSVLFRLVKNWVIKMDEVRPKLIEAIEDVEFQPEFMKKRMLDWLINMGDWSISRKRYYGIPLPFYVCPDCGEFIVVGSIDELKKLSSEEEVNALPHLHRPYIDNIKINCPKCNAKVERIADVGDCWLDAGITPFSTKKYFTDKEFFNKNFPTDVVIEGKEQVRLWFYSLLVMSVVLTGKAPYKKVVCTAMLLDREGKKLSKSSPNNISIDEAYEKIGADVIRYLFASNNMMTDTRFGFEICDEVKRKFMAFWNAYVFYNTYAVLDKPNFENFVPKNLTITDKWLLELTNNFIKNSKTNYENQKFYLVIKDFEKYVEDLTNWYIRINRRRFWKSDDEDDKLTAYYCLYNALKACIKVMSPIIPFITEYIWQRLVRETEANAPKSIFLDRYPTEVISENFENLISQTEDAREVITLAQRLRNENQIKVKQPLRKMFLNLSKEGQESIKQFAEIIKDEVNVKEIEFESDNNRFNDAYLTVNFGVAGRVLKGEVQKVKTLLESLSADEMAALAEEHKTGEVTLKEFGKLSSELFNVMFKPKKEFVVSSENNKTIVLDITIDEDLLKEGMLRELVRQIQVYRKEANFKVEQRIKISIKTDGENLKDVVLKYKDKILSETLAVELLDRIDNADISGECAIGDEKVNISLKGI